MDAIFRSRKTLNYYRGLGMAKHLDSLATKLTDKGYSRYTVRALLISLRMVAEFLEENGQGVADLRSPATMKRFREHWHGWSLSTYGREPKAESFHSYRWAIDHLLQATYGAGLEASPVELEPLPDIVIEFLQFQRVHRGLSASSLHCHEYYLRALLEHLKAHGIVEPINVPLAVLDGFISDLSNHLSRRGLAAPAWVLRAFLGYLFFTGREPRDRSLLIANPQSFREMTIPKHLTDAQLEQALSLIDRSTAYGKRDWALFMVFCCLGLRADEVRRLRLGDLDGDARILRVHRAKGGGAQSFPLTPPLEEALEIYLSEARPDVELPELFLTLVAPIRPFRTGGSVAAVVSRYLRKVPGLSSHGSHVLRHTLARRLRAAGAPLGVIRRVLGHASADTTHLYLRIAFEELREVADNYAELL